MRLFALLSLFLTLSVPLHAQEATGTIAAASSDQMDADIAVRMRDILSELGNYSDVTVMVNDGVITLRGTANSAVEAAALQPLAARIEGVVAVKNEVVETTEIVRRLDPAMDRFRARIDQLLIMLPLAAIAATVFALVVGFGFWLARARQPWNRLAPNAFIADLYRQIVRLAFVVGGIVIALDILNATALLSTILGAAGIIGLAIGFAVRDTVENFIASVMLSIRQPFRPNDTVEINGDQGKVIRLTSRATILLSFDGNHIRIPNATVFKSRIINYSQNEERRFMFSITVDRDADLAATRNLIAETVQALPFILDEPAAQTWIDRLDPAGAELQVTGWIDQNKTSINLAKGEAIRLVKLAVENAGVLIPDSTQRIILDRKPVAHPTSLESTRIAEVGAVNESSLEKMIDEERGLDENEDLLRDGALKE